MLADSVRRWLMGLSLVLTACGSEPQAGVDVRGQDDAAAHDGALGGDNGGAGPSDASSEGRGAADDAGSHGADASEMAPAGARFPPGFVFGSAVAGFQVDMGCPTLDRAACEDPNS